MNNTFFQGLGDLGTGVEQSFQTIGSGALDVLPKIIAAFVVFIVGWVIAVFIGRLVAQIIRAMKLDRFLEGTPVERVVTRAGFSLNLGGFVGGLFKWFVIIVFLVASLDILGLETVNIFLQQVVLGYLPQVIIAVFILLIAAVLADTMQKVVVGSAKAAEIKAANFLGLVTRWSIWTFAILMALYQLGVAPQFMYALFVGIVAMLSLAGGLAFGLGGRDAAAQYIEKVRKNIAHHE